MIGILFYCVYRYLIYVLIVVYMNKFNKMFNYVKNVEFKNMILYSSKCFYIVGFVNMRVLILMIYKLLLYIFKYRKVI